METRSLVVVSAGLSQPSSTRLLANRLAASVERQIDLSVEQRTIELRDHAHDLADNLLTGFASADLQGSIDAVLRADGLIAVSPIFNASYSGLFKSFFDVIEHDALRGMPVLIGATGGTARHSLALEHALRPLFAYLGAAVVPTAVYAAAEDWGHGEMPADAGLADRIERAAGQLALTMTAIPRPPVADPFEEPTSFEQLLGGTEQRA
jgi:FMN reductase